MTTTLLELKNIEKKFKAKSAWFQPNQYVHAVNGVSLELKERETIGIVGESGCGKSTTGRCVLRLIEPTSGEVIFQGKDITKLSKREMNNIRKDIQMVFQDPMASMNSKLTIREILSEPLIAHKIPRSEHEHLLSETMKLVGLSESHLTRFPHQMSGGQRQRVGIARAIILRPKIVVLDEPVSALDVSVQSQILNLLQDLQEELGLSYLFISHDLGVVEHIAHRVGVMYLGEMVEVADKDELFEKPFHPYTKALISAIPKTDPDDVKERIILKGELPSPANPPSGCKFHPRCTFAQDICISAKPEIRNVEGRQIACHLV
ncbi:dipeptide ABC transporter ATP-binding protein [Bacillus luteolus]|uniref:Dipeptide ABC transporter ATP-binding protein n=1 Tax=Litchfieldia luteola TaxID=682179 RepID=A0ABR9QL55_9BACI|nr:dipeptide ABC transporter ATP-binding protein [Cytobacillus luteolus]MBE4909250.1 dipeptide ABC transporter ATP-binding protein [Cytobacillus luteolus]MBP1940293.1 oligopeptide/dipeptide ABC transporter ATP-binding protein [Cytobacillus luteolus]